MTIPIFTEFSWECRMSKLFSMATSTVLLSYNRIVCGVKASSPTISGHNYQLPQTEFDLFENSFLNTP